MDYKTAKKILIKQKKKEDKLWEKEIVQFIQHLELLQLETFRDDKGDEQYVNELKVSYQSTSTFFWKRTF